MALEEVTYFNLINKINKNFEELAEMGLTPAAPITTFTGVANLPTPSGTYADLAAARAYDESLRAAAETRLDNLESKVNQIITALRTTGIITQ